MARPIAETPVLEGMAAIAFEEKLRANENRYVSQQERDRMLAVFQSVRLVDNTRSDADRSARN